MIALVVNFVAANTVSMHTHQLADGTTLVHSHPYYPAASHSHTGAAIDSISAMNISASSFLESAVLSLALCTETILYIDENPTIDIATYKVSNDFGRAPPAMIDYHS